MPKRGIPTDIRHSEAGTFTHFFSRSRARRYGGSSPEGGQQTDTTHPRRETTKRTRRLPPRLVKSLRCARPSEFLCQNLMGPSQPSQGLVPLEPVLADQTYAIRGLHAPHCLLAPVSRLPSPSPMTDCVPAQGSTSLRSRLSEVYNSLKVCPWRSCRADRPKASWSRFEHIYPGSSRSRALRGEHRPRGEGDPVMAQSPFHRGPSLSLTITRAMSHPSSARCSMRMRSRTRSRSSTLAPPPLTTSPRTSPDGPPHLFCSIACGRRGGPGPLASSHCPVARSDATARAEALAPRPTAARRGVLGRLRWPRGLAWGAASGSSSASWRVSRCCGRQGRCRACPAVHRHTAPTRPPPSSVPRRRQPRLSLKRVRPPRARRQRRIAGRYTWAPPRAGRPAPPCVCGTERGIPRAPGHGPARAPRVSHACGTPGGAMSPCVLHRDRTPSLRETTLRPPRARVWWARTVLGSGRRCCRRPSRPGGGSLPTLLWRWSGRGTGASCMIRSVSRHGQGGAPSFHGPGTWRAYWQGERARAGEVLQAACRVLGLTAFLGSLALTRETAVIGLPQHILSCAMVVMLAWAVTGTATSTPRAGVYGHRGQCPLNGRYPAREGRWCSWDMYGAWTRLLCPFASGRVVEAEARAGIIAQGMLTWAQGGCLWRSRQHGTLRWVCIYLDFYRLTSAPFPSPLIRPCSLSVRGIKRRWTR